MALMAYADRHWPDRHGEGNGNARMNTVAVQVVRVLSRRGVSVRRLAAAYGLSRWQMYRITRGRVWT